MLVLEGYGFVVAICDFKRERFSMAKEELTMGGDSGMFLIKLDWKHPVGARLLGFPGGLSHF